MAMEGINTRKKFTRTFGSRVLGRPADHKRGRGKAVEVITRSGCHS